uniref:Uncharacterized protein n=1 Tax=Ditylenchus dipsaci TaxID=166011 RepID=A0A915E4S9_9BILA
MDILRYLAQDELECIQLVNKFLHGLVISNKSRLAIMRPSYLYINFPTYESMEEQDELHKCQHKDICDILPLSSRSTVLEDKKKKPLIYRSFTEYASIDDEYIEEMEQKLRIALRSHFIFDIGLTHVFITAPLIQALSKVLQEQGGKLMHFALPTLFILQKNKAYNRLVAAKCKFPTKDNSEIFQVRR